MDASCFAQVVGPVIVEVTVGHDGAELEDGFGSGQSPSRAGNLHAVSDKVAACAFDDAVAIGLPLLSMVAQSR